MPIYEYKCKKCDNEFDKILPFSKMDEPQKCDCGEKVERVKISKSNFTLKGRGYMSRGRH